MCYLSIILVDLVEHSCQYVNIVGVLITLTISLKYWLVLSCDHMDTFWNSKQRQSCWEKQFGFEEMKSELDKIQFYKIELDFAFLYV